MGYFAEPDNHSKKQIKVELYLHVFLDLSKTIYKIGAGVDSSKFAKNVDLANFK